MASGERRKCKSCHKLFRSDPRSRYHQRYCAAQSCRAASEAASQARWLAAPENQDYFRGPANVARVKRVNFGHLATSGGQMVSSLNGVRRNQSAAHDAGFPRRRRCQDRDPLPRRDAHPDSVHAASIDPTNGVSSRRTKWRL
jgi:hypothetical protein